MAPSPHSSLHPGRPVPLGSVPPASELPPEPPENPEEWSDEQWLAWLQRTDDASLDEQLPPRVTAKWRDRPTATVLGAAMLGLRDAIYGQADREVAIVRDAPGGPPDPDRPQVYLDPEHPELSRVVVSGKPRRRKRKRD